MFLFSVAMILIFGLAAGYICKKIHIPSLVGMILVGVLIGPQCLDLLDESVLSISGEIRTIALIIILIRAGVTLNIKDLKKVGRPAVLLCFLPAVCEIAGMAVLGPVILDISMTEALIMGTVVAAVSPAVIVPRMIDMIEKKQGTGKSIPQMILAGASVDDVVVIVLFEAALGMELGEGADVMSFINIPVSILLGVIIGVVIGLFLTLLFRMNLRKVVKVLIMLAIGLLLKAVEGMIDLPISFSALLAVMAMGIVIKQKDEKLASELSQGFNNLWVGGEVFLFVLVGASVSIDSAVDFGAPAVLLVLLVLLFRMVGVVLCVLGTGLTTYEKLFCIVSYMPKATVQAALGGVPLAMGLECGSVVLTVSVLAILITAPLGAFGIDIMRKRL